MGKRMVCARLCLVAVSLATAGVPAMAMQGAAVHSGLDLGVGIGPTFINSKALGGGTSTLFTGRTDLVYGLKTGWMHNDYSGILLEGATGTKTGLTASEGTLSLLQPLNMPAENAMTYAGELGISYTRYRGGIGLLTGTGIVLGGRLTYPMANSQTAINALLRYHTEQSGVLELGVGASAPFATRLSWQADYILMRTGLPGNAYSNTILVGVRWHIPTGQ